MKTIFTLTFALALGGGARAEDDIPLRMPEERGTVEAQAEEFSAAITPALAAAARSTVRIWSGSSRLAYGTVVGDGTKILTKWSEISRARGELRVDSGNDYRLAKPVGVYEEEDLVLLGIEGRPLTPVGWSFDVPAIGTFLAAPRPDGRVAAFGVVSVAERNLRDTDLAYLGVIGDPEHAGSGVKIGKVAEQSGAEAAGLKAGNVIIKVGDRAISGLLALKNALTGVDPGTTISLLVEVDGREKNIEVLLGNRPEMPQFSGGRLRQMERMGGPISQVRDSFTRVIQTDMRPNPNQIGGPVVDLKGRALGITMARADRTRSFVMPAEAIEELLKKPGGNPLAAQARNEEKEPPSPARRGAAPRGRAMPGGEERMRRHLTDMQRLMEHMEEEMDGIEGR